MNINHNRFIGTGSYLPDNYDYYLNNNNTNRIVTKFSMMN